MLFALPRDGTGDGDRPPAANRPIRSPGFTRRPSRVSRTREQLRTAIETEQAAQARVPSGDDLEQETQRRFEQLTRAHPKAMEMYLRTAPTSRAPSHTRIIENVEVAAVRKLGPAQELAAVLSQPPRRGRPSTRRLPLAIFERNIYGYGRPEILSYFNDFFGSDDLLDWAFDQPVRHGESGYAPSSVYATLEAMLDRHDPTYLNAHNVAALRMLAKDDPEIGRFCAIDGTAIEAHLDQHGSVSPAEESLITRGMPNATFKWHDSDFGHGKAWRGYNLLVISDIKTTLPVVFAVIPANQNEAGSVCTLLDRLFALWPSCPIEYLVGDSEYSRSKDLALDLECRYGIHPVFPLRSGTTGKWMGTDGVPTCAKHGLMRLRQSDDFFGPKGRMQSGSRMGPLSSSQMSARMRWSCIDPECPVGMQYTYVKHDPRLYTYLPRRGSHWRTGLRHALMVRRNSVEAIFANLKARGAGLKGQRHPKWISSDRQMEWLLGGSLIAMTLRRLAHESGAYAEAKQEATDRRLLKVTT